VEATRSGAASLAPRYCIATLTVSANGITAENVISTGADTEA